MVPQPLTPAASLDAVLATNRSAWMLVDKSAISLDGESARTLSSISHAHVEPERLFGSVPQSAVQQCSCAPVRFNWSANRFQGDARTGYRAAGCTSHLSLDSRATEWGLIALRDARALRPYQPPAIAQLYSHPH